MYGWGCENGAEYYDWKTIKSKYTTWRNILFRVENSFENTICMKDPDQEKFIHIFSFMLWICWETIMTEKQQKVHIKPGEVYCSE